jgi:hypothetical protein
LYPLEIAHRSLTARCPLSANSGHRRVHSVTSSAAPSSQPGDVVPSAFAALRLITWRDVRLGKSRGWSLFSAGKRHREPHCISRKPYAWPLSDIRQYCRRDSRRRPGKNALHRHHTRARHCSPMQRILREVFLVSFGSIRERRLCPILTGRRPLRRRCTAFSIPCHKPQPFCVVSDCLALEQHCSGRQKSGWQQREATPE